MKLSAFFKKSLDQRIVLVDHLGTLIATCQRPNGTCRLFHLDEFFAEVWIDGESGNIFLIMAYTNIKCLEKYLDQISLNSIQHLIE